MDALYMQTEDGLFDETYGVLKRFILGHMEPIVGDTSRIAKLLDYTCKGGKMTRGKTVSRVVHIHVSRGQEPSTERTGLARLVQRPASLVGSLVGLAAWPLKLGQLALGKPQSAGTSAAAIRPQDAEFLARVLGWCIEILQAHFLVLDDVMDSSEIRRGQPCWYKLPNVGSSMAINDGSLLRSFIFLILHNFVKPYACYQTVVELFFQVAFLTECGQMLDVVHMPAPGSSATDFSHFTEENVVSIVRNKTAYYTFFLPLALGLAVTGDYGTTVSEAQLKEISFLIGEYFQFKDDMLDCFGDPAVIGKVGTDIQDNKCSWLAAQFLKCATPEQAEQFKENYGRHDAECVEKVKALYRDVQMEKKFEEMEAAYAAKVERTIAEFASTCPVLHCALTQLWKVTYKRTM